MLFKQHNTTRIFITLFHPHVFPQHFFLISNIKILLIAQYIGNVQKGKSIKKPNYNDLATQEGKYKKKKVKQDTIREE